ncbi:hypothetical protein PROAA_630014 [Candidatus Propionivibrio aalborgensis]|uniref:Uncharacterized protein n=1 Tax=Candidatus Propionivibrio aalborgensis TaxID=1860101 RepID=A0A1A8Y1B9_9RHOO|nr:hypothetical protein PROAA_630014 [Candidatus Propionivibrio aalborgensis]
MSVLKLYRTRHSWAPKAFAFTRIYVFDINSGASEKHDFFSRYLTVMMPRDCMPPGQSPGNSYSFIHRQFPENGLS